MKGTYLGEFEELVLLAIAILQQEGAYGNTILQEMEIKTGRSINLSAVHTALHRLAKKGFVKSRKGEPTGVRGGKRKIYYELTAFGVSAIKQSRELRETMWSAIPKVITG